MKVLILKLSKKVSISYNSLAFYGILLQVLSTQGILMYVIFNKFGFWELKKVLHPIGVLVVMVPYLLKLISKKRVLVSAEAIILYGYLFISYLIGFTFKPSLVSLLYSIREMMLIFMLMSVYEGLSFKKEQLNTLSLLLLFFTGLNILFIILTQVIGPKEYMLLLTERYYWPIDPLLKFKISNFFGSALRSPGLIGESASVGYFGVLSFFFIMHSKYSKYYWFPLMLVFLSFTRSAYLVLVVYGLLTVLRDVKYFKIFLSITPFLIGVFFVMGYMNLFSLASLMMRLDWWFTKVSIISSPIYGGNLLNIGAAAIGSNGMEVFMDSYWLYIYHGLGLVGIVIVLYFILVKLKYSRNNLNLFIGLAVSGFFVTLTQSIPFIVFFPMLVIKSWWRDAE